MIIKGKHSLPYKDWSAYYNNVQGKTPADKIPNILIGVILYDFPSKDKDTALMWDGKYWIDIGICDRETLEKYPEHIQYNTETKTFYIGNSAKK